MSHLSYSKQNKHLFVAYQSICLSNSLISFELSQIISIYLKPADSRSNGRFWNAVLHMINKQSLLVNRHAFVVANRSVAERKPPRRPGYFSCINLPINPEPSASFPSSFHRDAASNNFCHLALSRLRIRAFINSNVFLRHFIFRLPTRTVSAAYYRVTDFCLQARLWCNHGN